MKLLSGDAKKVMASPISSILPKRWIGAFLTSTPSGELASSTLLAFNRGVSIKLR